MDPSHERRNTGCRLKKPLYGLKQTPCVWHSKITEYLHQIGFRMSKSDNSLYIRSQSGNPLVNILYVDDLVIGGKNLADINNVKSLLSGKFEMKDMHDLHYFLGIKVIRTPVGTLISQRQCILNLLYKFAKTECQPVSNPSIATLSSMLTLELKSASQLSIIH